MKLRVECKHGVIREVEPAVAEGGPALRLLVRDLLLACPACYFAATSEIEEPGV